MYTSMGGGLGSLQSTSPLGPVYMEWGTPVKWGWFLLFSRSGGHKTKETYLTRPGSPTPCKQALTAIFHSEKGVPAITATRPQRYALFLAGFD